MNGGLTMVFGAGWFTWLNPTLAAIIHLVIFLIAIWYMVKVKKNMSLMWAFLLLALSQLFFAFVQWNWMDLKTTIVIGTVFTLVAILLVGMDSTKMANK